jgi:hypothetical protein
MCVTSTPMFVCEHIVADCCALQVYRTVGMCSAPFHLRGFSYKTFATICCLMFTVALHACTVYLHRDLNQITFTKCVTDACTRRWAHRPQQAPPPAPPPRHPLRPLHHHPARHPLPALLRKHRQCQEKRLRPQQAPPPAPPHVTHCVPYIITLHVTHCQPTAGGPTPFTSVTPWLRVLLAARFSITPTNGSLIDFSLRCFTFPRPTTLFYSQSHVVDNRLRTIRLCPT